MIDKDKLIETCEIIDIESREYTSMLSREQVDWLCENQEKFCGSFSRPYEIKIDFGPVIIDIMANLSEIRQRIDALEALSRPVPQQESVESKSRETGPIDLDSSVSL